MRTAGFPNNYLEPEDTEAEGMASIDGHIRGILWI